jgi:intracellular sulfur oxidation DsrE/DsrF family protein
MMYGKSIVRFGLAIILAVFITLPNMACAYDDSAMAALKPIPEGKAFFDMNTTLMSAEMFPMVVMEIVQTYDSLVAQGIKPDFVVSFRGANVVWLTESTSDMVKGLISQLDALGVKIDLCRIPLELFGVDPATVLPEINIIENGWISSISYQSRSKGYAVITF